VTRDEVARLAVRHLRVINRRDGFLRVAGADEAHRAAGIPVVDYLADGERGRAARGFTDELHRLKQRMLMLAEAAA